MDWQLRLIRRGDAFRSLVNAEYVDMFLKMHIMPALMWWRYEGSMGYFDVERW
jgi:hypothetical protein